MFSDIFVLNKDVYDMLGKLKEDYTLALLSNTNELHFNFIVKNFHIDRIFKKFILSFEVKAQKPDKNIFEAALEKLRKMPEECLYIDDVKMYIESAKKLGFNALHFTDIEKLKEDMAELGIYSHSYI
jgi:putative hydrolase of the HAD superfamily